MTNVHAQKHRYSHQHLFVGIAFAYVFFFTIFFFKIGTLLNWPFLLIPPFYLLYAYQLNVGSKSLGKFLKTRVAPVTIISLMGLYVPWVSLPFLAIFTIEIFADILTSVQKKQFKPVILSEVFLFLPLVYLIFTRAYAAGICNIYTAGCIIVGVAAYVFYRRVKKAKRLIIL